MPPSEATSTLGSTGVRLDTSTFQGSAGERAALPARPRVSIVIPAYNAESTLAECLARIFQSTYEAFEVVLIDDGSTDGTRAAVCGVQAVDLRHRDLVSQYKNLWMRWTYLRPMGEVPLFYTTAAAILRTRFWQAGGFDPGYTTPSLEDTAFGQKLARLGIRVRVQPDLEVEHVKRYSLASLLRTDFRRAVALVCLKLRHRAELGENNTSVPTGSIVSIPLAGLGTAAPLAGVALGLPILHVVGAVAVAAVILLNRAFLDTIRINEGWSKALASVALLWLELIVAGVGASVGLLSFPLGKRY